MSIRVNAKGGRTSVETDYEDGFGNSHTRVHQDSDLLGAMRSSGIDKVEVDGIGSATCVDRVLHDAFDKEYRKTHDGNYFGW